MDNSGLFIGPDIEDVTDTVNNNNNNSINDKLKILYNKDIADILVANAKNDYKFLNKHDVNVLVNYKPLDEYGYAETFPIGEEGDPNDTRYQRPKELDINKPGVEVYNKNFSPADLAAEYFSHIDSKGKEASTALLKSFSKEQVQTLKQTFNDYGISIKRGQSEEKALENAAMGALRGVLFNQAPEQVNKKFKYTPEQTKYFDILKKYITTGK